MTEENGTTWENWERNTEESHEYADFILKELGTITNAVSKECAVFLKNRMCQRNLFTSIYQFIGKCVQSNTRIKRSIGLQ